MKKGGEETSAAVQREPVFADEAVQRGPLVNRILLRGEGRRDSCGTSLRELRVSWGGVRGTQGMQ